MNYNQIIRLMTEFPIDYLNRFGELIIDEQTNTYAYINDCESIEDVETRLVYALCRPIGKGLDENDANRLLKRVNGYFNIDLSREDMKEIYTELCYVSEVEQMKRFVADGLPMDKIKDYPIRKR